MSFKYFAIGAFAALSLLLENNRKENNPSRYKPNLSGVEISEPASIGQSDIYDVDFFCRSGKRDALLFIDKRDINRFNLQLNLRARLEENIENVDGMVITISTEETIERRVLPSMESTFVKDADYLLNAGMTKFCSPNFLEETERWTILNGGTPCPDPALPEAKSCYYKISTSYAK